MSVSNEEQCGTCVSLEEIQTIIKKYCLTTAASPFRRVIYKKRVEPCFQINYLRPAHGGYLMILSRWVFLSLNHNSFMMAATAVSG